MIPTLHIQLLGNFLLRSDDTPVTTIDSPRLQALLAYFLLHRDAPQPRPQLAFLLWPDTTEAQAHTNLRTLLHRLRRALPEADRFLHVDAQTVHWRAGASWTLDVADFERAVAQADQAERAGDQAGLRAALQAAIELYSGDLLPGCYDDWLLAERERLRQAFLAALERLILLLEQEHNYPAAINAAQRLLRHDPLHEATYGHLMRLHTLSGDRASALRTYHTCATVLERELAVAPSSATREAYERLVHLDALPVPPIAAALAAEYLVHARREARPVPPAAPPALVAVAPLVGRQSEWTQLQAAWRAAEAGGAHLVLLTGEAGIGKTRLAEEVLVWADRQGIVTASARCYAAEGDLAYAPVATWLRMEAIRATLPMLDAVWLTDVARLVPEVLVERPDLPRPGPLTERWQRQRLFESLARAALGDRQPRLLLLDDLQWCDQETLEWLHYLLRLDLQARMLLVGTVRPEETASDHPLASLLLALRRSGQVTEIALEPLDAAATAALAAHVAGRPLDPDMAAYLHRDTEGNPLFVVECARTGLFEQVAKEQGTVDATSTPYGAAVPPTVQAVIAARLAQLSPPARELVGVVATIGRAFTFAVLARATQADEPTLVRGLDELWQRRIVREHGADAYDFSHDKLREAAYVELSAARRRLLHRRVAEAFEVVYAHDLAAASGQPAAPAGQRVVAGLTPMYPLLAHHWRRAGDEAKTIEYLAKAGEQALYSGAHPEAVRLLSEALTLDVRHGPGSDRVRQALWERQLGEAHLGLGHLAESRTHLERALVLLGWPMPVTRRRLVASLLGQVLRQALHRLWPARFVGRAREARATLLEAARAYAGLEELFQIANERIPFVYSIVHGLNLAETAGPSPELARLYADMCLAAGIVPLHPLAEMYSRQAWEAAQNVNDLSALSRVLVLTGIYSLGAGQWAKAQDVLSQGAEIADRLGDRRWRETGLIMLAVAHRYQGELGRSAELLASVYASARQRNDVQFQRSALIGQAGNALVLGRMDEAAAYLEAAAAVPTEDEILDRADQVPYYGSLAVVHLRHKEEGLARQAAEAAAQLTAQTRPILATLLVGYARVAEVYLALWEASRGQPPAERAALAQAARQACAALHGFARVFPIGQPQAWLWQGLYDWLAGQPRPATKAWRKALAAAERLTMPYEQGLAHYEIGRHAAGPERQEHLARACALFAQLGAAYDLARAKAAQHGEALPSAD